MLEVGKLYVCEKYHLLFYPDPDTASAAERTSKPPIRGGGNPAIFADFLSNRFGKPVLFLDKNIPLLFLNSKKNFYEVLTGDKKGWIIFKDWLNIKEIV